MRKKFQINTDGIEDRIKQTLQEVPLPIYGWMLDTNLRQAELLTYAALFDELRHEPLTPKYIKLSDVAKRLHYDRHRMYEVIDNLVSYKLIYRQGTRRNSLYSLYPFNTLDLK